MSLLMLGAGTAGVVATPLDTFVNGVLAITGASETNFFWLAQTGDTTTSTTKDAGARTLTWDADVSARLSAQGDAYIQSFNGTSEYGTAPDTADLSIGNGSVDEPLSVVCLVSTTDTAVNRRIINKEDNTSAGIEWQVYVTSADVLRFGLRDTVALVTVFRASDSAITQGSLRLLAAVYTAATGGATAMNDVTLYQDASAVASTATNNASFDATSDTNRVLQIGATGSGTKSQFFSGSMGFIVATKKVLTEANLTSIKALANTYYGLAL